jgi:predicted nucleic acid binding AN1-type Zn finger protein
VAEENVIAFCGLICDECPAFTAKRTDNNELRKKTAEEWSSPEWTVEAHEINCDGCISEDELFKHCTICKVRTCGSEKGVTNCAYCTDYPCGLLEELWNMLQSPEAKERLDTIRKGL